MVSAILDWLSLLTGGRVSYNGNSSQRVRKLIQISKEDPELKALLSPITELIRLKEEGAPAISGRLQKQESSIASLKDHLKRKNGEIANNVQEIKDLTEKLRAHEVRSNELTRAASDLSLLPEGSLAHEIALDEVMRLLPQLWRYLSESESEYCKVRPTRVCNRTASKESFKLPFPEISNGIIHIDDLEVVTFTAPKPENIESRLSEDRVGFVAEEGVCRLVAVDGVASSAHGRHLAKRICEAALTQTADRATLRDALRDFGEELAQIEDRPTVDERLSIYTTQQRSRGSACVLAIAEFDINKGTVEVAQLGDTVAFVEVSRGNGPASRREMSWLHFPEISTGDFDSAPDQLNSSEPQGIEDLQVTEIGHATGRIVLCTDGMAEYMLRRGIDEVLEGVLSNDPEVSLDKLRNDGIAEDDLSMVALHSNKTRDFKKRGERIRMGGKGGEVNT